MHALGRIFVRCSVFRVSNGLIDIDYHLIVRRRIRIHIKVILEEWLGGKVSSLLVWQY